MGALQPILAATGRRAIDAPLWRTLNDAYRCVYDARSGQPPGTVGARLDAARLKAAGAELDRAAKAFKRTIRSTRYWFTPEPRDD